jgi:MoaA/NifB/PqqE/SkfB family radical SAM enzyme
MSRYLALARDLQVHEVRVMEPMPTGKLVGGPGGCRLNAEERRRIRSWHLRTNRSRRQPKVCAFAHVEADDMYGCGAGFQHLYIDAQGNVCPCDFTPISFGNVRQDGLHDAWQRMRAAFARPGRTCFLLRNASALAEKFNGRLPFNYDDVRDVCRFCDDELPGYYARLAAHQRETVSRTATSRGRSRFPRPKTLETCRALQVN